jgi:Rrf2 family protein
MIKFSKKVEYALIALVHMSKKPAGELTTARELSDKFAISLELMGKILQRLAQEKLIISVQGVKGGYFLAKKIEAITVGHIIKIIDGAIRLSDCVDKANPKRCERFDNCLIKNPVQNMQNQVYSLFDGISLKDFQQTA